MDVYKNGVVVGSIMNPWDLEAWGESYGHDPATLSLLLSDVKVFKETEMRDLAEQWYKEEVRIFEGMMVQRRRALGISLSAYDKVIDDSMVATEKHRNQKIADVKAATTWQTCRAVTW